MALDSQNLPETSQMLSFSAIFERLNFPQGYEARVWLHRSRGVISPHRHAELEANLILSGHAFYLVDGRRFRLARRTLIWLFPAQNHLLIEQSADFSMQIAVWKPSLIENAVRGPFAPILGSQNAPPQFCRRLESADFAVVETLFARLNGENDADFCNAGAAFLLLECWRAWQGGDETVAGRVVHPSIERAARVLRDESPNLPELARRVGLSESRLSGQFKIQIGQSVTQFRAARQIERFLKLYDGRNSIGAAAFEAGFGSYAQFHRVFCQIMGCNPAQWRDKLRA